MNKVIFISYYTHNTPYEKVMEDYLAPSLKEYNLKYEIQAIENLGSWDKNTSYKPKFILEMLEKYKTDVIFLDADASIREKPVLLENINDNYDIAVHMLDWYRFWRNQTGRPERSLLSGTILFKYKEKNIELIKEWIKRCEKPGDWEQRKLQRLLKERESEYNIYKLPPNYCAIINRKKKVPVYMQPPIILHHQVSRLYKREVAK